MRLFNTLMQVPHDKMGHYIAGTLLYATGHFVSPVFALTIVAIAAVGKEVYDYLHRDRHIPDGMDAVATMLGGVVSWVAGL